MPIKMPVLYLIYPMKFIVKFVYKLDNQICVENNIVIKMFNKLTSDLNAFLLYLFSKLCYDCIGNILAIILWAQICQIIRQIRVHLSYAWDLSRGVVTAVEIYWTTYYQIKCVIIRQIRVHLHWTSNIFGNVVTVLARQWLTYYQIKSVKQSGK